MKSIFKELNLFRKNPETGLNKSELSKNPVKLFFILFGINLIISLFIFSSLSGFLRIMFNVNSITKDVSLIQFLSVNILFIPLLEETAFRLPLKINKINLSLSLFAIAFIASSYLYGVVPFDLNNFLLQRLLIGILILFLALLLLSRKNILNKIENVLKSNYKLFFYVLLFLFVLRHIDNYQINTTTAFLMPFLLLPQLISGFFIAYVRLKINFFSAVLFHFLINVIAFFPQIALLLLN